MVNTMRSGLLVLGALVAAACSNGSSQTTDSPQEAVALAEAPADTMVVYKSPTCGCCNNWVDHVEENGFAVVSHDLDDQNALIETKRSLGVPAGQTSCHTAVIDGYTIEGHVPADLIRKLLTERPRGVKGLAVPGMPVGSPGMEGVFKQDYDVLSFDEQGRVEVYAKR